MKSFIRKLALTGGAGVVLLAAGGTAATTVHAASPTALHCVISGTATISPGLGAPPGGPQTFNYSGSATCNGVLAGTPVTALTTGAISGSGSCPEGSLVTCVGVTPPISCNGSDAGASFSGNGTYVQAGANITVECQGTDSGGGAVTVEADAVFTPNPPTQTTVTHVDFHGSATVHTS